MTLWDHVDPHGASAYGGLPHGTRVTREGRHGTVSFTRSGFAKVRWDDGSVSMEWAGELAVEPRQMP